MTKLLRTFFSIFVFWISAFAVGMIILKTFESKVIAATVPAGFTDSTVFSGLNQPTSFRFTPDGRVFVLEKKGIIKVYPSLTSSTPVVFADLSKAVMSFLDRGLLGLAVDPNFPASPYIYIAYTLDARIGGIPPLHNDQCPIFKNCTVGARVSRLTVGSDNKMVSGSEKILIEDWCQQFPSHSIGTLQFDSSGALLIGAGDGADIVVDYGQFDNPCGDPINEGGALRSQDIRTTPDPLGLNGTIVRIDKTTGAALPNNPLSGGDAKDDRIIAYGFRNPFRFVVHPTTGDVWVGDVGWNSWEEINRILNPISSNSGGGGGSETSYLSDLNYSAVSNGWGPVEKDMSNGEQAAGDGQTLKIQGKTYAKGFGTHTNSEISYNMGGKCTTFSAEVGIDDEINHDYADANFIVYADGVKLFESGVMNKNSVAKFFSVNVTGKNTLQLIAHQYDANNWYDHANWADAKITCSNQNQPQSSPVTPKVQNFGWPCFEGSPKQPGYDGANLTLCESLYSNDNSIKPVYSYPHNGIGAAVSGLVFYNGNSYPAEYKNALFFADYNRGWIKVMMPGADSQPNPANIRDFAASGVYVVDLVTGPNGDIFYADIVSGKIQRIQYHSLNTPPTSKIIADKTSGPAPLTVNFDGSTSTDPEGTSLTYSWDLDGNGSFGDATSAKTSRTYTTNGTYNVSLRVTDQGGSSSISSVAINVGNSPPNATISAPSNNISVKVGQVVNFSGFATDPDSGNLPASNLHWKTILHHCSALDPNDCHEHPMAEYPGVSNGSITVPSHETPSYIELVLTATDQGGLTNTKSVRLNLEESTTSLSNILDNPSLESVLNNYPLNWQKRNGGVWDNTVKRTGAASLKVIGPTSFTYSQQNNTLEPNTTYTASAWVKLQNVAGKGVGIRYAQLAPTSLVLKQFVNVKGSSDWQRINFTFLTPANYQYGRLDLIWELNPGDTAWFDDISLCLGQTPCL